MAIFGSNKALSRSDNMAVHFYETNTVVIHGRILPKTEPYCRASFLIEIRLRPEYPFKELDVTIRDPIYHPNVDESGRHCCCWGFSQYEAFKPTTPLADFIEAVIRVIDNPDCSHSCNPQCTQEYQNDYQTFYKKALKLTLLYGRPRY
jgi:ubiquitin-protein ligase